MTRFIFVGLLALMLPLWPPGMIILLGLWSPVLLALVVYLTFRGLHKATGIFGTGYPCW